MSTSYPTALDSFSTLVDNVDGIIAAHPNDRGDSIEALEAKVGINSSAVTTSHDYLLTHLPAQAANWDAGGYEIRAETFESDVATGTAPLTVASTTVCTNLNADTVDGKHVAGANGAGEITTNDGSQTLTSKTLTSPDINGGTWNGTIDGNWTAASQTCANLGTVTTCDINGGTIDGVTIGAAAAPTVTNLGSVATCDINGGTIDGVTIGAAVAPTVTNIDINAGTVNGITSLGCSAGANITEFSTDGTMAGNSDTAVPTEKAVKTYVDSNASIVDSCFRAYRSGNQGSITAATWTKVQLNAESFDIGNDFDSSTNYYFTAPENGYYSFQGNLAVWSSNNSTAIGIAINAGGTRYILQFKTLVTGSYSSGVNYLNGSIILYLSSGANVYLEGYVSTATVNFYQTDSYLSGFKLPT